MSAPAAIEFFRSIARSKGRFIAIAVITALGTGFFAGLQVTAPDMRLAADQYLDQTDAWDIRVASTLGVDDEMVAELAGVQGVDRAVPEREADVAAVANGVEYSIRVHSFDLSGVPDEEKANDAASQEAESKSTASTSSNICMPYLTEGRYPQKQGECLLGADAVFDNPVSIGDEVRIGKMADGGEVSDTFETTSFTVVGFARSSNYICSSDLGSTSLGDGYLDDFMCVPMEDFNRDNPYTGAYLIVEGAADELSGSDAYEAKVDAVKDEIAKQRDLLVAGRLSRVKADGQEQIDEAISEYEQAKIDACNELSAARKKLDDALLQLEAAKQTLASSRLELENSEAKIAAARAELDSSRQLIAGYRDQYESGMAELAASQAEAEEEFASAEAQIDETEARWEQERPNRAMYVAQAAVLETAMAQTTAQRAALQEQLDKLVEEMPDSPQIPVLREQIAALDANIETLEEQLAALQQAIAFIDNGEAQIAAARQQLQNAREEAQAQFDDAAEQLAALKAELDRGEAQIAAGAWQICESEAKIASGWAQLESGQAQYDSGFSEYRSGLEEYESGKAEAEASLADALAQIEDAQAELDSIESPELYVLDRNQNIGIASFASDADRLANIANVFPLIFFLVAALVSLTTMTRMVDEERVLIGTYKALGYSNGAIAIKYIMYALLASGIGCGLGVAILTQFLPNFIMNAYSIIYKMPNMPTPIDLFVTTMASALGIGVVLIATWWACASTLSESPAALMLPRAPKAGKRILLEHIGPLWRKMSFSWKVTARNIFRYKKRFIMAIIGVAGCTALLLTGFGLSDAINDILDKQFNSDDSIFKYDITAVLDANIGDDRISAIKSELEADPRIDEYEILCNENVVAKSSDGSNLSVQMVNPQDVERFADFVAMNERVSGKRIELHDGAVVISEKLSDRLGVGSGDTITLYEQDAVGDPTGSGITFTVGGVMECYVGNFVYVTPADYETAMGKSPSPNYLYVQDNSDGKQQKELVSSLLDIEGVSIVSPTDDAVSHYHEALKSVDSVVVILIGAAALLAFVVLYNLTNINIAERQREIATLKVLGFVKREVNAYIFRETLLLSAIGAVFGLFLGVLLCGFVVQTAEVDQVMFGREIHILSFAIAFALTMAFSALVSLSMMRKLERISMVESLKSVD